MGLPLASVTACSFEFSPPLVRPTRWLHPPFATQAGRRTMGFQVGRVDHDRLDIPVLGGQFGEDAREHPKAAPTHPPVVERLRRAIGHWYMQSSQPIAVYEDNPAQNISLIHARHSVRQRKSVA